MRRNLRSSLLLNRSSCLADDEANNSDDHTQDVDNDWKEDQENLPKTTEKVWGFSQGQTNNESVLKAG